jgi:two-component system phosphate regulon sensor histidine kinase PhoR
MSFRFKNQTPRQLALITACASSLLVTALLALLGSFNPRVHLPVWELLLVAAAVFSTGYAINYLFVKHYIYRRIKLIYKIIHRHKGAGKLSVKKGSLPADKLDEVEKEVHEWAEAREREVEEMEKLAAYRRRFIGDVSHELKTPIFNIQGFIYTLLDGAIHDPNIAVNYLERAAKNVERLEAIVQDLETIDKLESGQMLLDIREFDIRALTDEVFADLERKAAERNIRLCYKEGAAQHFRVRADKEAIRQVLINLVDNSIKYGREGGTTKVSFYDMDTHILLEVSDNGIGIDAKDLPHVFDRFYRVDKSRSREAGGTGLGLSIVKHIVEAHKQTIHVRSNFGQGSTFGLTLEKA